MVYEEVLSAAGLDFTIASSGLECLRLLESHPFLPDLVLLDVMMPGMSGLEVLERIRADPLLADLPVILCTALDSANFLKEAMRLGATGHLPKPISRRMLLDCMLQHLPDAAAILNAGLRSLPRPSEPGVDMDARGSGSFSFEAARARGQGRTPSPAAGSVDVRRSSEDPPIRLAPINTSGGNRLRPSDGSQSPGEVGRIQDLHAAMASLRRPAAGVHVQGGSSGPFGSRVRAFD